MAYMLREERNGVILNMQLKPENAGKKGGQGETTKCNE